MEVGNVEKQITSVRTRAVCALIGLLLLVAGTLTVFSPMVSYVMIIIGYLTFFASFGAMDVADVQRIAGAGAMGIGSLFILFALNPNLDSGSTALAQNPGGEAVCGYSEENPCTVRHLKTFLYSLFWR